MKGSGFFNCKIGEMSMCSYAERQGLTNRERSNWGDDSGDKNETIATKCSTRME